MADQQQTALAQFKHALQIRAADFKKLLPANVSVDRFMATAQMAVAKDPKLLTYDQTSLFFALREACRLGFEIGDRGMYLVPFKQGGVMKVVPIPSWKALCTAVRNAENGPRLVPEVVREGDRIEIRKGTKPEIIHEPRYSGDDEPIKLVYSVAMFPDGSYDFEVMSREQIEKVRSMALAKSTNPDASPWTTWPDEQARKTVLKRHVKRLDISPKVAAMVEADNRYESGESPIIDVTAEVNEEPAPQPTVSKVREAISKAAQKPQTFEIKKPAERQPGDDGDDVPNFQDIP